jgi:serine/threonine protein kinase
MDVAIKHLQFNHINERAITDFHTELAVMKSLKHPNIVLAMGACVHPVCLVTEFCANGSLFDVLHNKNILLTGRMKLKLAYDIVRGMNFLHTHSPIIIHRDLKSLNLLVDSDWNVKVSDFGLSRFKVSSLMTGQCGTYQWMAPEVVRGHNYTEKADVYSFGINLWEIYTRDIPYNNMIPIQAAVSVMNHGLRPQLPKTTPLEYSMLVQDCWNQNPNLRPSFHDILSKLANIDDLP